MRNLKVFWKIFWVCIISLAQCNSLDLPNEPSITANSIVVERTAANYNMIVMSVDFEDGDGDLGLERGDTTGKFASYASDGSINKYRNNFFVEIFRYDKQDMEDILQLVTFGENQTASGRFPLLSETPGKEEPLVGTIKYTYDMYYNGAFGSTAQTGDSLVFKIHIADRALNESNTVELRMRVSE